MRIQRYKIDRGPVIAKFLWKIGIPIRYLGCLVNLPEANNDVDHLSEPETLDAPDITEERRHMLIHECRIDLNEPIFRSKARELAFLHALPTSSYRNFKDFLAMMISDEQALLLQSHREEIDGFLRAALYLERDTMAGQWTVPMRQCWLFEFVNTYGMLVTKIEEGRILNAYVGAQAPNRYGPKPDSPKLEYQFPKSR